MRSRRGWIVAAIAAVVGLFVGIGIGLFDASGGLSGGSARALLVRVENEGHLADVTVGMRLAHGGPESLWKWPIPDGASQTARDPDPPGEISIRIEVEWTGGGRPGRGEATFLADPADCAGREMLRVFLADTANGVSIKPMGSARCI